MLVPRRGVADYLTLRWDGLAGLRHCLEKDPENEAIDAIVALRRSVVVAVPGIVAERHGGGRGIVLVG